MRATAPPCDRRRRGARRVAAALLAAALAGCGGGVWIGWSSDDFDNLDPSVSLTTAATSVAPGGSLRVAAAAADADGIDDVAFFRRDAGRWVFVGNDRSEPYEAAIPVPDDGRAAVEVFARATDRSGRQGDSAVLSVPVRP